MTLGFVQLQLTLALQTGRFGDAAAWALVLATGWPDELSNQTSASEIFAEPEEETP